MDIKAVNFVGSSQRKEFKNACRETNKAWNRYY